MFLILTAGLMIGLIKQTKSVKQITEAAKIYCKDACK
jgi:hypothetical protein